MGLLTFSSFLLHFWADDDDGVGGHGHGVINNKYDIDHLNFVRFIFN